MAKTIKERIEAAKDVLRERLYKLRKPSKKTSLHTLIDVSRLGAEHANELEDKFGDDLRANPKAIVREYVSTIEGALDDAVHGREVIGGKFVTIKR